MNVDGLRRFCLSFPQAKEKLQWGENLCFKVRGKLFAILNLGSAPQSVCFKSDPERFGELTERAGVMPAPYLGRYKWVLVESLNTMHGWELEELLGESYRMVEAKAKPARSSSSRKLRRRKSQ